MPVLIRIPAERVSPIAVPELPQGPISNGDLEKYADELEDGVAECNIDRQWIRDRQKGVNDDG